MDHKYAKLNQGVGGSPQLSFAFQLLANEDVACPALVGVDLGLD